MVVEHRIEGLSTVIRGLGKVNAELPREFRRDARRAADQIAERARTLYRQRYRQRSGRHARRIRARASTRSAAVLYGGAKYPEAPGQEFGSAKHRQFAPWTGPAPGGRGAAGRFLNPAARTEAPRFRKQIERSLGRVIARAGLDD